MKDKVKILETHLVISTGFLIIYLIKDWRVFLYLAAATGATGIFIRPLAAIVTKAWYGLAVILNKIMSTLILFIVYYLVLVPLSVIYKISEKRKLDLKNPETSMWHIRDHHYQREDLKNVW